jgi:hypothetical protein
MVSVSIAAAAMQADGHGVGNLFESAEPNVLK